MENASKALLMAGGLLIGILILSLAVYLFVTFGNDARTINEKIDSAKLTKFNAQFNIYDDRDDITIYDIISLANLAEENNKYYKDYKNFASNYKITIEISGITEQIQSMTKDKRQDLLINNSGTNVDGDLDTKYSSKLSDGGYLKYNNIGRVWKMKFKKL